MLLIFAPDMLIMKDVIKLKHYIKIELVILDFQKFGRAKLGKI